MIRLEALTKVFPSSHAGAASVDRVSFEVAAGETCVLLGPSGCGKTTTLRMINRLVTPTSGKVFIAGRDTDAIDPVALRRTIGYVIQQIGLFPNMTVAQNIGVVPRLLQWDAARMRRRAEELLAMLALEPAEFMDRYPNELSGRTGATGRRRARARRRSAGAVDGRAVRRRGSSQSRSDPGRVPAHAEIVAQDRAVREPRHRRGGEDGRPHRDLSPGPAGAVRGAGRAPRAARQRFRRRIRRQRPHVEAAAAHSRGRRHERRKARPARRITTRARRRCARATTCAASRRTSSSMARIRCRAWMPRGASSDASPAAMSLRVSRAAGGGEGAGAMTTATVPQRSMLPYVVLGAHRARSSCGRSSPAACGPTS